MTPAIRGGSGGGTSPHRPWSSRTPRSSRPPPPPHSCRCCSLVVGAALRPAQLPNLLPSSLRPTRPPPLPSQLPTLPCVCPLATPSHAPLHPSYCPPPRPTRPTTSLVSLPAPLLPVCHSAPAGGWATGSCKTEEGSGTPCGAMKKRPGKPNPRRALIHGHGRPGGAQKNKGTRRKNGKGGRGTATRSAKGLVAGHRGTARGVQCIGGGPTARQRGACRFRPPRTAKSPLVHSPRHHRPIHHSDTHTAVCAGGGVAASADHPMMGG